MESSATAELINIIRTLHYDNNTDADERDKLIKKIETEFDECDKRIDLYIRNSSKDLSRLIKVFNDVSRKIENSRAKMAQSREALRQCKVLLQSKRDDIRRLLLEWWEQKSFYENIKKLNDLSSTPDHIHQLCSEKKYFEAAKVIGESSRLLESEFVEVAGLHEIKRQIDDERVKLEHLLYQELSDQFYTSVRKSILESGGGNFAREASFKRRFRQANSQIDTIKSDDTDLYNESIKQKEATIDLLVKSALNLNNLLQNMNILEKMINDINKNISTELLNMIHHTSNHVLESNLVDNTRIYYYQNSKYVENNPKLLCQLLELTFEQFKLTAHYYNVFISCASKQTNVKYQSLIWQFIQNVLIQLLEEYLDTKQSLSSFMNGADLNERNIDINMYFAKKKGIMAFGDGDDVYYDDKVRRKIFVFKKSLHSLSLNKYIQEKNNETLFTNYNDNDTDEESNMVRVFKTLVCQPSLRNITSIFSTMEHVLRDISDETKKVPNIEPYTKIELTLEKYLEDFILNTFIRNAVQTIIDNANTDLSVGKHELSKQLISMAKQRELNLTKPILQSTWLVYECCYDLFKLMNDMNTYASEFAKAMNKLIENHIEYCMKLFSNCVRISDSNASNMVTQVAQMSSTGSNNTNQVSANVNSPLTNGNLAIQESAYSVQWVQDESINKYFTQLPSFSAAIKGRTHTITNTLEQPHTTVNASTVQAFNQAPQINYSLLSKEVETINANLFDKELEEINIITNFQNIETIAQLHESFDWLIVQLKYIQNSILQMIKNPKSLNSSLSISEQARLNSQVSELEKLRANTLLLVYIETRVHCYHHLYQFIKQENNTIYAGDIDTDPDECVLLMNRDLHRIYEHLSRSLQDTKVDYVFDGLGYNIATIFIKAIKNLKKISSHGIAKICRNIFHVEQNLSAIRTRSDPHLMKAHRFYELLYKKPEELLNFLEEHEAEFQEADYINLLNLIYRSQPGCEVNSLTENQNILKNIIKRKNNL